MTFLLGLLILVLTLLGTPLFIVISAIALYYFYQIDIESSTIMIDMYRIANAPVLIAIPLFTFAGYIMAESKTPQRLVNLSRAFLGWMPGGLAVVAIVACSLFTAFTGASGVTIIALGGLLYPALIKEEYPEKVGLHLMSNFTLPRLIFAGSDVLLHPSKFEPCGITQLEAMRYGSVPIVRAVGGLADTVESFDSQTGEGTGFTFRGFDKWELFAQIVRAYENFHHPAVWKKLARQSMGADFSWVASAKRYVELYHKALHFRHQDLVAQGIVPAGEGS